jgi:hypothetical protein
MKKQASSLTILRKPALETVLAPWNTVTATDCLPPPARKTCQTGEKKKYTPGKENGATTYRSNAKYEDE